MLRLVARTVAPVGAVAALAHQSSVTLAEHPPPKIDGRPIHIGAKNCAFAGRTAWALYESGKAESFEMVDIPLGHDRPTWLRDMNPSNTVPVVLDANGQRLPGNSASLAALLLDDANSTDEFVLEAVHEFDTQAVGPLYAFLRCTAPHGSDSWVSARTRVEHALARVEACFVRAAAARRCAGNEDNDGPYFCGGSLSLADIAIVSVLWRFDASLRAFRGYDELVSPERTPLLSRAVHACAARDAFRAATPSADQIVAFYRDDAAYCPDLPSPGLDAWVDRMLAGTQPVP